MRNALETEDGKGFIPIHFGFETAFGPLLGSTPPTKSTPSEKRAAGDSGRDSPYSEDDWGGHLGENTGG